MSRNTTSGAAPRPSSPRANAGASKASATSKVKRGYDEASGTATVAASFTFPDPAKLIMGGAPGKAMGVIQLNYTTPTVHIGDAECTDVQIVVNAVPHDVTELKGERIGLGYRHQLSGYTSFEWYKPLATRFPEFSVRACGTEVAFNAAQIDALKQFLTIYSELAVGQQQQTLDTGGAPLPPGTQL